MSYPSKRSRVLLLGATGNLGSRLLVSLLAHHHTVIALIRSPTKLASLVDPSVLSHPNLTVIEGDATDSSAIHRALRDCDCDSIADVAGNQVPPWKEPVLEKIVEAVVSAAVEFGKQTGSPLRIWVIGGINSLQYPRHDGYLIQDYLPKFVTAQHQGTMRVIGAVPITELRWSSLCVAMMKPALPKAELLAAPKMHNLILKADEPPEWRDSWAKNIPFVGDFLNLLFVISQYTTELEDVADFLAEDLESENSRWIGKKVGMKQKDKRA